MFGISLYCHLISDVYLFHVVVCMLCMCDWIGNIGAFETSFMYVQNFIILSWVLCYAFGSCRRKELHYTVMGFVLRVWFMLWWVYANWVMSPIISDRTLFLRIPLLPSYYLPGVIILSWVSCYVFGSCRSL